MKVEKGVPDHWVFFELLLSFIFETKQLDKL